MPASIEFYITFVFSILTAMGVVLLCLSNNPQPRDATPPPLNQTVANCSNIAETVTYHWLAKGLLSTVVLWACAFSFEVVVLISACITARRPCCSHVVVSLLIADFIAILGSAVADLVLIIYGLAVIFNESAVCQAQFASVFVYSYIAIALYCVALVMALLPICLSRCGCGFRQVIAAITAMKYVADADAF
jgi:hypothetical protein